MSSPIHILVIPFPAQGHLIPLLDLVHRLLSSLPNLTATVLTTPNNLPLITSHLSSPSIQPLVLPLPSHPSLPPHVEHVRELPTPSSIAALIHALSFLSPKILAWARAHPNPPTAVMSDFFLGWTHSLSKDLSVPRFAFYSSGALVVAVFDCLFRNGAEVDFPSPLPSFRYEHLPTLFRRHEAARGAPEWDFVRQSMVANSSSYAAVFNTFDALESKYLDYLRGTYGHDRVWAVGPIAPSVPGSVRGGQSSVAVEEVTAWLDACPARSVVYLCFGSQFEMSGEQARAIASALELGGARFVWGVGPAGGKLLPDGFEERTRGKGMVIRGWAPQVAVLGHAAVGAFLTHCGWNSVLEGVVNGTVLLTWPMTADQFVNSRLLVEEMGVAVSACEGGPGVVPEPEVLGRVLAESVDEKMLKGVKARAAEMGRIAAEAVAEGGSSWGDLEKLVKEMGEVNLMK